jgi:carbon storage regulator
MLVLSRKTGERIAISGSIVVSVVEVKRGTVRLGIEAPPDVRIVRHELLGRRPRQAGPPQAAATDA